MELVEALQEHGFTASDAKTYVSLLEDHPATGYELAARSGVPRSAIYNVLRRLEGLGLVSAVQDRPAKYVPLPPERLLATLRSRFSRSLDALEESLEKLSRKAPEAATWIVQGYDATIEQAAALVAGARRSVYASAWRREVDQLADALEAARGRGVEIILFSFNELPQELGTSFCYGIEEDQLEPYWPHKMIMVVDGERALAGGTEPTAATRTVVTEEPALVEMAVSNLVLDITLLGQRKQLDTEPAVNRLTRLLAPVEELAPPG
jgi:predicted transcriptional regulator